MKRITLVCKNCPRQRIFKGENDKSIMAQIDESGWIDLPSDDTAPGIMHSLCPTCED